MEKKGRGTPWILLELNVRSVYRDYFKFCTVYLKGKNNYPVIRNVKFAVKKFKEGNILFNDTLDTFLFTVIWCQTYGKGPLR